MADRALFEDILRRTEQVVGAAERPVQLHAPFMNGNEEKYVSQTIRENWVSTAGAFVGQFERDLAAYCGMAHAVAVVNGTAALHACLLVHGIGRGDEVLVPSATFVASGNAIAHAGATPHFIDCEEKTLGADPEKLRRHLGDIAVRDGSVLRNRRTGARIAALMPVHIFGVPCDIDTLQSIADEYGLIMIQDATEALGSSFKGASTFQYGACAALSFNGNKIITSGGGGAVLTNDPALAARLKHITTTAKKSHAFAFYHDEVGYNYRMPNINAALAYAQLEQMPDFLRRKKILADAYRAAFADLNSVDYVTCEDGRRPNYWLNTIRLKQPDRVALYEGIAMMNERGIQARPLWTPLHELPMYATAPRMADLSVTESTASAVINLPSSAFLRA